MEVNIEDIILMMADKYVDECEVQGDDIETVKMMIKEDYMAGANDMLKFLEDNNYIK